MKVAIVDFYKDVTGANHQISTPVARRALDRWQVPYDTTTAKGATKQFWKVDIAHLGSAKTLHEIEIREAKERKNKAKPLPEVNERTNPVFTIMERMAALESEVAQIKRILSEFVSKF